MKKTDRIYARISSITFKNFRNIRYGEVKFANGKLDEFLDGLSSVTGIYGQNGSGKTTVIMAIEILQSVLLGDGIMNDGYIAAGEEVANLSYIFSVYDDSNNRYNIQYSFDLFENPTDENDIENSEWTVDTTSVNNKITPKTGVKNETVEYDGIKFNGEKIRRKVLFSTLNEYCANGTKSFGTKANTDVDTYYENIIKKNKDLASDLRAERQRASKDMLSFFFYNRVYELIYQNMEDEHDKTVYGCLRRFGNYIITSNIFEAGINDLERLPLVLFDVCGSPYIHIRTLIHLSKDVSVPEEISSIVESQFRKIDAVISQLIPEVNIALIFKDEYVSQKDPNKRIKKYKICSVRNGVELPLRYESNGIRRLLSFLTVLISAYNNPSVTFAIDEFDSGIFEDLLGKLVQVFNDNGKGQIIFTSHNLRPLEVLDSDNIVFTTVNNQNRFIRIAKQKNNNLRDKFLRAIKLGGEPEWLYNDPDEYRLKLAFASSGKPSFTEED